MKLKFKYLIYEPDFSIKQKAIARINSLVNKHQITADQYNSELIRIANEPTIFKELKHKGNATEDLLNISIKMMFKDNGQPYADRCELSINGSVYIALMSYEEANRLCGDKIIDGYTKQLGSKTNQLK